MTARIILRNLVFIAVLSAVLFAIAGRFDWPGGYAFLGAMGAGAVVMESWLALTNPGLLWDRKDHKQKRPLYDRILLPLLFALFPLWLAYMAFEVHILGIDRMPRWANFAGAAVVFFGFAGNILVFRANRFATAVVKVQEAQTVCDREPYAIVRHPMYAIGVLIYFAIPFALGTWTGLAGAPLLSLLLAIRVLFEEAQLKRELAGYAEYMAKVRYRLIPFVW